MGFETMNLTAINSSQNTLRV